MPLVARTFLENTEMGFVRTAAVWVKVHGVVEMTPQLIWACSPAPGSFTSNPRPTVFSQITNTGSTAVDPTSIVFKFDGSAVAPTANSSFLLDLTLPALMISQPATGFGNNGKPALAAGVTDSKES